MTTDPTGEWLAALGALTAASMTADDARVKIAAYAALLRTKYPASAFTTESLEAVAATSKFFPSYGEVCERLTAYWEQRRPPSTQAALSGDRAPPGQWLKSVTRRLEEGANRATLLSIVRAHAPPSEVLAVMAAHYPAELQAEADHAAEVRRDKALAAERVIAATAAVLKAAPLAARPVPSHQPPPAGPAPPEPPKERLLNPAHTHAERNAVRVKLGLEPLPPPVAPVETATNSVGATEPVA